MAKEGKFAIIGLGRVGSSIAKKLADKNVDVLCIDNDKNKLDNLKDLPVERIIMDSTDKDLLVSQDIKSMDAVVVSIGENFEALVLTTFLLKELKVKRIIARARDGVQKDILEKIGVTEILCPEEEIGNIVSEKLLNPKVLEYIYLEGDYDIVEVMAPKRYIGNTILETNIRDKYNLNIVTILRKNNEENNESIGVPEVSTVINENDLLLLFGKGKDIERFIKINH